MNRPGTVASLLGGFCYGLVALGVLAAEPFNAASSIYQALFAGKERVANRADFDVNVALVGRARFKIASAGALDLHCGVIGVDIFLGHRVETNLS